MAISLMKRRSAADEKFGYEFSVDGLMSAEEAQTFLGGISRRTLYRRVDDGKIRIGKQSGKLVVCRRSVTEYAKSLER